MPAEEDFPASPPDEPIHIKAKPITLTDFDVAMKIWTTKDFMKVPETGWYESYLDVKKESSKTKKKAVEWYDKLDEYKKLGMTKSTKIIDRVCAVTGSSGKDYMAGGWWQWYDPYWVLSDYSGIFRGRMCIAKDMGEYEDGRKLGYVPSEPCRYTLAYLTDPANNFAKLYDGIWADGYQKKDLTVEFVHSESYPNPVIGDGALLKSHYIKCPYTGLLTWGDDTYQYRVLEDGAPKAQRCSVSAVVHTKQVQVGVCYKCDNRWLGDLLEEYEFDGGPRKVCPQCLKAVKEKEVIRHYNDSNFLPAMPDMLNFRIKGKPKTKLERRMFGVEVELGFNKGDRVDSAIDVWETIGKDFCYIKHDGSITKLEFDDGTKIKNPLKMGFEIVSAPAGINHHRERWKKLEQCANYKNFLAWDTQTCGFHVHVSRAALTQFQIGRILVFMNHKNNRHFIDVVAGRGEGYYNKFMKKDFSDCDKTDESKYTAVRTNKKDTIEFRIFRGTINYKHIIRNIEFCDAVCDFCAPCQASLRDMGDFRKFLAFVDARRSRYPILSHWLTTIDLIAKKKVSRRDEDIKEIPLEEALTDKVKDQLDSIMKSVKSDAPLDFKEPKPKKQPLKKDLLVAAADFEADPDDQF